MWRFDRRAFRGLFGGFGGLIVGGRVSGFFCGVEFDGNG